MKPSSYLRSFLHDQQGSVLIIAGLTMLTLVAVGGSAIDFGRQQLLRAKLQQSTDAAAVAVATMPQGSTAAQLQRAGERYFMMNFPANYMGVERPAVSVQAGDEIEVTAQVNLPTRFVRFIGVDTVTSAGRTRMSSLTSTSGGGTYDIILSMDNSGSMMSNDGGGGTTRLQALRNAANTISRGLLEPNTTNSRIAANRWSSGLLGSIDFQNSYGPVSNFLNGMVSSGGTCSTAGMNRAVQQGAAFRPDAIRAVVLLTDGVDGCNSTNICNQLKSQGILVYTIAQGTSIAGNPTVRAYLGGCASGTYPDNLGQYFFEAANAQQLENVFQQILTSVTSMRILD